MKYAQSGRAFAIAADTSDRTRAAEKDANKTSWGCCPLSAVKVLHIAPHDVAVRIPRTTHSMTDIVLDGSPRFHPGATDVPLGAPAPEPKRLAETTTLRADFLFGVAVVRRPAYSSRGAS